MKRLIILVVVLTLGLAGAGNANAALTYTQALSQVDAAVAQGKTAVVALVKSSPGNLMLQKAILARSTTTITTTGTTPTLSSYRSAISSGCHYSSFQDKHSIALFGVVLLSEQVTEYGFCWNGWAITWWGGSSHSRWSAFGYCWTNTGSGDNWNYYPTWREAYTQGEAGGQLLWGCQGFQWDNAHEYYANGGGIFKY